MRSEAELQLKAHVIGTKQMTKDWWTFHHTLVDILGYRPVDPKLVSAGGNSVLDPARPVLRGKHPPP